MLHRAWPVEAEARDLLTKAPEGEPVAIVERGVIGRNDPMLSNDLGLDPWDTNPTIRRLALRGA